MMCWLGDWSDDGERMEGRKRLIKRVGGEVRRGGDWSGGVSKE